MSFSKFRNSIDIKSINLRILEVLNSWWIWWIWIIWWIRTGGGNSNDKNQNIPNAFLRIGGPLFCLSMVHTEANEICFSLKESHWGSEREKVQGLIWTQGSSSYFMNNELVESSSVSLKQFHPTIAKLWGFLKKKKKN